MSDNDSGIQALIWIAAIFIGIGLTLLIMSIPMFITAWAEYREACPEGTTKVECQ